MDEGGGSYRRLLFIAILIGIVSGFGSLLFFKGLGVATEFYMGLVLAYQYPVEGSTIAELAAWAPSKNPWLIVPVICLDGLVSAFLAHFGATAIKSEVSPPCHALHAPPSVLILVPFVKILTT